MTARSMLYAGVVIPAAIVDRIEAEGEARHGDALQLRDAFVVGAWVGFVGRTLNLGVSTARAEAWRDGMAYGASLRPMRCHACKGLRHVGPIICQSCNGTGVDAHAMSPMGRELFGLGVALSIASAPPRDLLVVASRSEVPENPPRGLQVLIVDEAREL